MHVSAIYIARYVHFQLFAMSHETLVRRSMWKSSSIDFLINKFAWSCYYVRMYRWQALLCPIKIDHLVLRDGTLKLWLYRNYPPGRILLEKVEYELRNSMQHFKKIYNSDALMTISILDALNIRISTRQRFVFKRFNMIGVNRGRKCQSRRGRAADQKSLFLSLKLDRLSVYI